MGPFQVAGLRMRDRRIQHIMPRRGGSIGRIRGVIGEGQGMEDRSKGSVVREVAPYAWANGLRCCIFVMGMNGV